MPARWQARHRRRSRSGRFAHREGPPDEIGRAIGEPLAQREGRFLKKKYFDQTHAFFERYGARALVIGRFVPIVRTFITVVAGIGKMDRRHFFTWSFVGAVLWATGLTLLGYFLGGIDFLQRNLEAAVLVIVFVSVLPMVFEFVKHRRKIVDEIEDIAEELDD